MALLLSFKCAEVEFDLYDSERVPVGLSEYKYYVTPDKLDLITQWLQVNKLDKIETKEQMDILISLKLLGTY